MLVSAMRDRDPRLRAFGLEALLRSDEGALPSVATTALLDELVQRQLGASNKHYRARVEAALARLVPGAGVSGKREWARWWRARLRCLQKRQRAASSSSKQPPPTPAP